MSVCLCVRFQSHGNHLTLLSLQAGPDGDACGEGANLARALFVILRTLPLCPGGTGGQDETQTVTPSVEILTFGHSGTPVGVWHELGMFMDAARSGCLPWQSLVYRSAL